MNVLRIQRILTFWRCSRNKIQVSWQMWFVLDVKVLRLPPWAHSRFKKSWCFWMQKIPVEFFWTEKPKVFHVLKIAFIHMSGMWIIENVNSRVCSKCNTKTFWHPEHAQELKVLDMLKRVVFCTSNLDITNYHFFI